MSAAKVTLYCEQGATFLRTVTLDGVDLEGATPRGTVRSLNPNQTALALDFTCTITNAAAGEFTFSLTADETSLIYTTGQQFSEITRYAYSLELLDADGVKVTRLLNGDFVVSPSDVRLGEPTNTFAGELITTFV